MNTIVDYLIDRAVKQHGDKFVGKPTKVQFDFDFKEREFPKIEKSNITTVNPIK